MLKESTIFQKRLKARRNELHLTQDQLAVALGKGYSKYSISNYESKGFEPGFETLVGIAEALSCTTDYLLGKDELPTKAETDLAKATGLSSAAVAALISYWNSVDDKSLQLFLSDLITSTHLLKIARFYRAWQKEAKQPAGVEAKYQLEVSKLFEEGKYTPELVNQINESIRKAYIAPLTVEGLRYSLNHAFESFLTESEQREQENNKEV